MTVLLIIISIFTSLSCATITRDNQYYEALKEIKAGNIDFAFIKLNNYLREYPNSVNDKKARFAVAEYLFQIRDYHSAIYKLAEYIKDYPQDESTIFMRAILYKILLEYEKEPELMKTMKENLFSESLFLIFSESKIRYYKSILNNTYKIMDYVDKIEVYKNNDLLLKITP